MYYFGCAQIIQVERSNMQLQMWFSGQKNLEVTSKEILIKDWGGAVVTETDTVARKILLEGKKRKWPESSGRGLSKGVWKAIFRDRRTRRNRQCSHLATLGAHRCLSLPLPRIHYAPSPFHDRALSCGAKTSVTLWTLTIQDREYRCVLQIWSTDWENTSSGDKDVGDCILMVLSESHLLYPQS